MRMEYLKANKIRCVRALDNAFRMLQLTERNVKSCARINWRHFKINKSIYVMKEWKKLMQQKYQKSEVMINI